MVAGIAVDRAVALEQHVDQQLQVALAQGAKALQLGLAQEFRGERRRVLEFELLHGSCLLRCASIAGGSRRGRDWGRRLPGRVSARIPGQGGRC